MSKQDNLTDLLTDVASAIREKKGTTAKINPQNFSEEIRSIEGGGETAEVYVFGETMVDKSGNGLLGVDCIIVDDGVTSIENNAFQNARAKQVILPSSMQRIGSRAFQASFLEEVIIPDSVTEIDIYAFNSMTSLTHCVISNALKVFTDNSFSANTKLKSIIVPPSVIKLGARCFRNNTAMMLYDFSSHTSVPALENINAFEGISSQCKIVVPDNLYDEWIAATNWSTYASRIVKASDYVEPTTE